MCTPPIIPITPIIFRQHLHLGQAASRGTKRGNRLFVCPPAGGDGARQSCRRFIGVAGRWQCGRRLHRCRAGCRAGRLPEGGPAIHRPATRALSRPADYTAASTPSRQLSPNLPQRSAGRRLVAGAVSAPPTEPPRSSELAQSLLVSNPVIGATNFRLRHLSRSVSMQMTNFSCGAHRRFSYVCRVAVSVV